MDDTTNIPDDVVDALKDPVRRPEVLIVKSRRYQVQEYITNGFKSALLRVLDDYNRPRAAKLAWAADYQTQSYLQETHAAAVLSGVPVFADFVDVGPVDVQIPGLGTVRFICFLEEWVEGRPLEMYLKSPDAGSGISFLLSFIKGICEALSVLGYNGLTHDDLHAGNIMVTVPRPGLLRGDISIKIVDTGSLKPVGSARKSKDDHRRFTEHIASILNVLNHNRMLIPRDRRFAQMCVELLRSMLDDDPTIALRDPAQILEQFELAYTRAAVIPETGIPRLSSPFEYLSAEHIADDRLLLSIFAKSCPWLEKVAGPDPCLVTGPRGCGKSTIFRWLSLKAHLVDSQGDFNQLRIAGFYISCNTDLQNRLSWLTTDALATRFRREIVHYFNLIAAREVVTTLHLISCRTDRMEIWGFSELQERSICGFINQLLGPPTKPSLQGVSLLIQIRERIEAEMMFTHSQMLRGLNLTYTTAESFLAEVTTLLFDQISFFKSHRPTFLVDDFSVHRIPAGVQKILNRIIWERRPSHVFKLSSEKYGAILSDPTNATIDITREMVEIDCGREYIALDDAEQSRRALDFAIELLDNRLRSAGYKGTAVSLIGDSEWDEGSLALALITPKVGREPGEYHGLRCIAQLCSGDVSSLLLVYSKIFESGHADRETTALVSKSIQSRAIRNASRAKFEAIKPSHPYGSQMYAIAEAFGNLVRKILFEGKHLKKGTEGTVPSQCPRIEIDQLEKGVSDTLTHEQRELALELIRRAVFIEMEPGLSRHGSVTTLRWHFRRVFLPTFGAALAKNDAIKENPDWFKFFLTSPNAACDSVWKRRAKHSIQPKLEYGA